MARYVRIRPVSITGRRIAMPANLPFTWWGRRPRPGRCRDSHDGDTGRASGARRRLLVASFLVAS